MVSETCFLLFMTASLVLATVTAASNGTTAPEPFPELTYKCDGNGSYWLNFSALTNRDTFIITDRYAPEGAMYKQNGSRCTTPLMNTTSTTMVHLTGCKNNPILFVMINRTGSLTELIGGRGFQEYELECKLPGGGMVVNLTKDFSVTPPKPTTKTQSPFVNLTMDFKAANMTSKSAFEINERVILDIHDNSAVPHVLKLLTCNAYPDQNKTVQTNLYDNTNNYTANEIIENVTTGERDINVELRAFRFVSSSTTYIQCTVRVCNANDTKCSATRRRRAAAEDLDTVRTVEGSFSIVQPNKSKKPVSFGQPTVRPWCASIISAIALVVSIYVTK